MKVINSVSVNAEFENSSFYSDVNAIKKQSIQTCIHNGSDFEIFPYHFCYAIYLYFF